MKTAFQLLVFTILSISVNAQNRQQASVPYGNNPQAGSYALAEGAQDDPFQSAGGISCAWLKAF